MALALQEPCIDAGIRTRHQARTDDADHLMAGNRVKVLWDKKWHNGTIVHKLDGTANYLMVFDDNINMSAKTTKEGDAKKKRGDLYEFHPLTEDKDWEKLPQPLN